MGCRLAGRLGERDRVRDQRRVDVDGGCGGLQLLQLLQREGLAQLGRRLELPVHDCQLVVALGVADQDLEHEAVDLRLGQRICPLRLDRVLRRHHEEGTRHRIGRVADRDLSLLHHLEQRGLHLGRGAVDLVGQQEVAEDGPQLGVERAFAGPVDAGADEIGGDEVRRELDAGEAAAEHSRGGLDRQRLGETGHALDQQMALAEQADEDALQHLPLARDHAPDLEEGLLETFPRLVGRQDGLLFAHVSSLGRCGSPHRMACLPRYAIGRAGGFTAGPYLIPARGMRAASRPPDGKRAETNGARPRPESRSRP